MIQFFSNLEGVKAWISEKEDGDMRIRVTEGNELFVSGQRAKFLEKIGIEETLLKSAILSHGDKVAVIHSDSPAYTFGVDALVAPDEKIFLSVTFADCFPVFFADPVDRIIGLTHAGWRGAVSEIFAETVENMIRLGSKRKNIQAAVGPGICRKHFEFDIQDIKQLGKFAFPEYIYNFKGEKLYPDLEKIIDVRLREQGIKKAFFLKECTYCHPDKYFSARRDKQDNYQVMMAVIGLV